MRKLILFLLIMMSTHAMGQDLDDDYDLVVEYGKRLLIRGDTTWSGKILIQDVVEVAPEATLTITPGTTVTFEESIPAGSASLNVFGKLVAVRSKSDEPIVFINGRLIGSYADLYDPNGYPGNRSLTYPHPQFTLDGVEYYSNQLYSNLDFFGISRVQNSFFYGSDISLDVAISFENNTLINSNLSLQAYPVEGDLRIGHYYDILNNDISWDEFYFGLWPVVINDAYTLRFEGNNLGGVYRDEEPFQFWIVYTDPGSKLNLNSNYINFDNYLDRSDFFFDEADSLSGGEIIRGDLLSEPNPEAGWGQTPSLDVSQFRDGDLISPIPDPDPTPDPIPLPIPDPQDEINEVNIVVAPFVIGNFPVYVAGLTERKRYSGSQLSSHTLEYDGVVYDYDDVDQYLTIVERGGAFTDNFRSEMLNVVSFLNPAELNGVLGSSYADAIIFIVGFDGNYAN